MPGTSANRRLRPDWGSWENGGTCGSCYKHFTVLTFFAVLTLLKLMAMWPFEGPRLKLFVPTSFFLSWRVCSPQWPPPAWWRRPAAPLLALWDLLSDDRWSWVALRHPWMQPRRPGSPSPRSLNPLRLPLQKPFWKWTAAGLLAGLVMAVSSSAPVSAKPLDMFGGVDIDLENTPEHWTIKASPVLEPCKNNKYYHKKFKDEMYKTTKQQARYAKGSAVYARFNKKVAMIKAREEALWRQAVRPEGWQSSCGGYRWVERARQCDVARHYLPVHCRLDSLGWPLLPDPHQWWDQGVEHWRSTGIDLHGQWLFLASGCMAGDCQWRDGSAWWSDPPWWPLHAKLSDGHSPWCLAPQALSKLWLTVHADVQRPAKKWSCVHFGWLGLNDISDHWIKKHLKSCANPKSQGSFKPLRVQFHEIGTCKSFCADFRFSTWLQRLFLMCSGAWSSTTGSGWHMLLPHQNTNAQSRFAIVFVSGRTTLPRAMRKELMVWSNVWASQKSASAFFAPEIVASWGRKQRMSATGATKREANRSWTDIFDGWKVNCVW